MKLLAPYMKYWETECILFYREDDNKIQIYMNSFYFAIHENANDFFLIIVLFRSGISQLFITLHQVISIFTKNVTLCFEELRRESHGVMQSIIDLEVN